jgi:multicomponent K+:H+ antiporter subunit A
MPYTATLAMTAAASMAGVPLLNGFLSKEMFFGETLFIDAHRLLQFFTPAAATLAGVFSVAYSMRFIHDVFFNGEPVGLDRRPHEPPRWMKIPVEVLVLVCLAVGIFPQQTVGPLLALAARPVVGGALPEYSLAIWHGFNVPLIMSLIALAGGVMLYFGLHRLINLHTVEEMARGGRQVFDWVLVRLLGLARGVTAALESGSLQRYLALLVGSALVAGVSPFVTGGPAAGPLPVSPVTPAVLVAWAALVLATAATVVFYRQRLIALVMLGVVGLCVSLIFVYFSAPDLALTQLLVEVVSIILMMLALYYLPRTTTAEGRPARQWRDGIVAVVAGAGMAALVYAVLTRPGDSIAGFFLDKSLPEGGGTNAVNVIIVDFRAFDTVGEITVFGIAALAIYALLREFRAAGPLPDALPLAADRHPLLLAVAARLLLPLAAAVSLYLFLRGHNLPGGGFIAGLVLALAMILQYVAFGSRWVEARLSLDGHRWLAAGLLLAGLTGIGSWAFGHPFLTSSFLHPVLPLIGELPIASAMFFDAGVYLTVVGGTLLMLAMLGRIHTAETQETR